MDLKLYNPDATCPKCNSGSIGKEYCLPHVDNENQECLRRVCKECNHNWYEHCADYGTAKKERYEEDVQAPVSCSLGNIDHTYITPDKK